MAKGDEPKAIAQAPEDSAYRRNPFVVHEIESIRLLLEERRLTFNNRIDSLEKAIGDLSNTYCNIPKDVAVLASTLKELRDTMDQRLDGQDKNVKLALAAAEKTTAIAQATADKAVVKAEAAASREYLEAQITALSNVTTANQFAQKEAINAALVASEKALTAALAAAKEALTAALASSEQAITKAEDANEKRFQSVNEFRATLADQQRELATKSEVNLRINAIEDKLSTAISTLDVNKGKGMALSTVWAMGIAAVTVLIAAVAYFNTRYN